MCEITKMDIAYSFHTSPNDFFLHSPTKRVDGGGPREGKGERDDGERQRRPRPMVGGGDQEEGEVWDTEKDRERGPTRVRGEKGSVERMRWRENSVI